MANKTEEIIIESDKFVDFLCGYFPTLMANETLREQIKVRIRNIQRVHFHDGAAAMLEIVKKGNQDTQYWEPQFMPELDEETI